MIGRYSVAYCWGIYRACARPWVLPQHYVHVAYLQEGKFIVAPLVGERRLTVTEVSGAEPSWKKGCARWSAGLFTVVIERMCDHCFMYTHTCMHTFTYN